jgi:imidazolonepropionase-like amidohydrolase
MSVARAADGSGSATARPAVIVGGGYVTPDGTIEAGAAIRIRDGKIDSVVPADQVGGASDVVRFPGAVVCPGWIDVWSTAGATGRNIETAQAIDPAAQAIDVIDRDHRDFRSALEAGVTTVAIAPASNNLVCGAAAVVKTGGPRESAELRRDGPLVFALGSNVWLADRAPTSRAGSLAMLRTALDDARAGTAHERLVAFAGGRLDAMVACPEAMDVSAALRTFRGFEGLRAVVYTGDMHQVAHELSGAGVAIVTGPYTFDMSPRSLLGAATYATGGTPVVLTGQTPRYGADAQRITASLAVRNGMSAAAARRAVTAGAAELIGVVDRVGVIQPERDADLVVFSDDPLRLDARVLAVYVNGVRVVGGEPVAGAVGRSSDD